MPEPMRVFVGCAPDGADAESLAVLEYTLRKFASRPIALTLMSLSRDPASPFYCDPEQPRRGWETGDWATPFSGFRWAVPPLAGLTGRALYVDSDFIFRADLAELFDQEFPKGAAILTAPGPLRFCIALFDCGALRRHWPAAPALVMRRDVQKALKDQAIALGLVGRFGGEWNNPDGRGYGNLWHHALKAIHYTDMRTQPHLERARARLAARGRSHWYDGPIYEHPRRDLVTLFDRVLEKAIAAGFKPENYEPAETFGPVRKRSLAGYRGSPFTPGRPMVARHAV
jgi:hypothetical protein